jgi:hypothetical protein
LVVVLLLGGATGAGAQSTTADAVAGMDREAFGQWMALYYRSKQPQVMPAAIARASAIGIFAGEGLPPMLGFLAGYFAENPDRVDASLSAARSLPARDQQVVLTAAVLGARPGSAEQNALFGRLDNDGHWLVDALIARGIHGKNEVDTISPDALDFLWGVFFATGDAKSVLPIIATIGPVAKPENPTAQDMLKLAIHGAAEWSLGANARQHPAIMALCKAEIDHQPPEIAAKLRRIVQGQ